MPPPEDTPPPPHESSDFESPPPPDTDPAAATIYERLGARPWITWGILAILLLFDIAVTIDIHIFKNQVSLIEFGAKERMLVEGGDHWRLLTAAFLHQGFLHLLVNGWALWILGSFCEAVYGRSRFLLIYLGAALGGSLASLLLTEQAAVGASGAIFGLLGAAIVFGFRHKREIPELMGRRLRGTLLFWLAINLILGALIPIIDNWGHIGGLLAGTGLALALGDAAFARRGSALAYRTAALVAAGATCVCLLFGAWNRATVSYLTLADWALANDRLQTGDPAEALDFLDHALQDVRGREPWLSLIHLERARALRDQGRDALAEDEVDAAAGPAFERARYPWAIEIADGFVSFHRYDEGEKLYRRVLAHGRHAVAANNLAWMYLTAEDRAFRRPADALPLAELAVADDGENPFYLGTLGAAQIEMSRHRLALDNLSKAVSLHQPGDEGTDLYLLTIALAGLGMAEEARSVLAEAAARFPEDRYRRRAERAVRRPAIGI
jgi:rhomboid protease GluP